MENHEKHGEEHAAALESPAQCLWFKVEGVWFIVWGLVFGLGFGV